MNYILKEQTKWKICVVENEFGEVAIDDALVSDNIASREDITTMDNGCVCCSVRGDLVRTFGMLNSRRKDFDAIIIETTGLADPAPICFTFSSAALIMDNFRIDSVVCRDTKHVNLHLDEEKPEDSINEAENQIAFSDRIILNKCDLVSKDELEDVVDRIKSMNSFAKLIKTERSRAPLDEVLGIGSFNLDKMVEIDPTIADEDEDVDDGHVHDEHCNHDHGHEHAHEHNKVDETCARRAPQSRSRARTRARHEHKEKGWTRPRSRAASHEPSPYEEKEEAQPQPRLLGGLHH